MRLGWLGADRAEQQVVNDLALPQEVDLPEQQAGGGVLPGGCGCGVVEPLCGEP